MSLLDQACNVFDSTRPTRPNTSIKSRKPLRRRVELLIQNRELLKQDANRLIRRLHGCMGFLRGFVRSAGFYAKVTGARPLLRLGIFHSL
jgi:hypothetical protein